MKRLASVLGLFLLLAASPAADGVEAMHTRLQAERERAAAALAELQGTVEAGRREHLASIERLQRRIRERQASIAASLRALDAARDQSQVLQAERDDQQRSHAHLARRLAGEGLEVHPDADGPALLAAWPQLREQVTARLDALAEALVPRRQTRPVLDRQGHPASLPVWEWGAAQRLALGETRATRGLLRRLDDGSWQVAGPHLGDGPWPSGRMLADVSGRLANTEPQAGGPVAIFRRAGPFAWPILIVALLGLVIIADRLCLLWRWHTPRSLVDRLIADLESPEAAHDHLQPRRHTPTARILREVLQHRDAAHDDREQRAGAALVEAEVRLGRGLRLLAVLAAAAPLLGLLGTVTGMITSFRALDLGSGGNAGQLSAGIGEALLTTEFGLIVAVPLLLAHAIFARDAQRRRAQAESAAMRLLAALPSGREGRHA